MVPKYLQTGSTDILASIRQSVLRGESNSSPSPAHKEEQTELPLVTTTKKSRHCHGGLPHRTVFKST